MWGLNEHTPRHTARVISIQDECVRDKAVGQGQDLFAGEDVTVQMTLLYTVNAVGGWVHRLVIGSHEAVLGIRRQLFGRLAAALTRSTDHHVTIQ